MTELGVFAGVAAAIDVELAAATAALQEWPGPEPTVMLLRLVEVLRQQVVSLRKP